MPATDGDVLRLAKVVDRQRRDLERMRAEVAVSTVVATATGLLMERLGCSAADAASQLGVLAEATGVSPAEMAATVVGTSVGPAEPPQVDTPAARDGSRSALAVDGQELAATLAAQTGTLGVESVAIWLLAADGALELLGESGLGPAEAARWRLIPPQFDCPEQRVAHDAAGIWRSSGFMECGEIPVPGPPEAPRAILPLRARAAELLGVLELRWPAAALSPGPGPLTGDVKDQVSALANGCARVLATRLAHGDLSAAQPTPALFSVLDSVAGSVLVVRAIRDEDGAVTDFAIDHVSPGYIDPAGRDAAEVAGLTLLEAYPVAAEPPAPTGLGLFGRALRLADGGPPQYVPGPLVEAVPLADFRGVKYFDGALFTWRGFGDPGSGLTDLLDHVQRLGRLGGWEENLVTGTVRWTDSAFGIFGLTPDVNTAIKIADLHSYVIAADKAVVRRFGAALSSRGDSIPPDPPGPARRHPGAAGDAMSTTFRIVRPDDSSMRQIRVFAEPVADATGYVVALRGAFQDVSAHYLTQVALDATRNQLADTEQRAAEEHLLALRLQRAIMPPDAHPVEAAGIEVAVRYRPVGRGHLVGGDWYDTLLLPGGAVLLVVGDVAGHGIEAVTGMVAARNSLRGLAITGKGPASLIAMLNGVLCHLTGGIVGTVVCGKYDPGSRTLRWARAGHLPPVLVRDGIADAMPLPDGILLGMDPDAEYEEALLELQPGDTLLMFTDGLIERRSESIGDALDEFVAAASLSPGDSTVAAHADRLIATAVSDTEDDACLVAVRILLKQER